MGFQFTSGAKFWFILLHQATLKGGPWILLVDLTKNCFVNQTKGPYQLNLGHSVNSKIFQKQKIIFRIIYSIARSFQNHIKFNRLLKKLFLMERRKNKKGIGQKTFNQNAPPKPLSF